MLRKKNPVPIVSDADSTTAAASAPTTIGIATSVSTTGNFSLLGVAGGTVQSAAPQKKQSPAQIRMMKDIKDLDSGSVATVIFPNPNDLLHFNLRVQPDSGCWIGAAYNFSVEVPDSYPHSPPKVTCHTKIFHPNIDLEGKVCLNILRKDWNPVLDINAVIYGAIFLFYEPNPDDPLNLEAASLLRSNKEEFKRIVRRTLQGYAHGGQSFPKLV